MRQYKSIKEKYPGALLLFRVGDFYETFSEDAVTTAGILDIVLTKRSNGSASEVALAGFPHHALDTYLPKLVRAGYRVAICDQLEDPKEAKGIVKRGVTDLVSPGVVLNDNVLESRENNFLMAIFQSKKNWGWSLIDVSTGEFLLSQGTENDLVKDFQRFSPKEILYQKSKTLPSVVHDVSLYSLPEWLYQEKYAKEQLERFFNIKTLKGLGIEDLAEGQVAASSILYYLREVHGKKLDQVHKLIKIDNEAIVRMDDFTIRNLELVHSFNPKAVLLRDILDKTKTPMGSRLMRRWLLFPLNDRPKIEQRLNSVGDLVNDTATLDYIRDALKTIGDLERITVKVINHTISPKELKVLSNNLQTIAAIHKHFLKTKKQEIFGQIFSDIIDLKEVYEKINKCLVDDPPISIQKGSFINPGFHPELDRLRLLNLSAKKYLEDLAEKERARTGISSLKIGFNNVFGYFLEVRNTHKAKVPTEWLRKQTLVNAERYVTEELKTYEQEILSAQEKIEEIEKEVYLNLVREISSYYLPIQNMAKAIGQLDCLASLAQVAVENNYVRPEIVEENTIEITDGRHPVIEKQILGKESYISNSIRIDSKAQQVLMITGPNMSGKSAMLRQTALIVLMAQMGGFVPAKYAKIGMVDRIFTRVGASDNISQGESTFMVEMNEAASILNNLSSSSLVILDEIGRGTATYDGISIAWAIAQYLHEHPWRPLTLFATHYHELNEMENSYKRIKNYTISIKESKGKILFLRKLIPGGSAHSFGLEVAKMAGIPKEVVNHAHQILDKLERSDHKTTLKNNKLQRDYADMQLSFFQLDDPILEEIRKEIQDIHIDTLSPVEALLKLQSIKKKIGE